MKGVLAFLLCVQSILALEVDKLYSVDHKELRQNEMAENIKNMNGVIMGIAEYVMDIKADLGRVQREISQVQITLNKGVRSSRLNAVVETPTLDDPEKVKRNEVLAQKVEKLLAVENVPEVEEAKVEMTKVMESNFLKMLSAILVTGPVRTQQRTDEIFKLMKAVLNGELDFKPVVQKLPFILRESETNQFISLLKTLRDTEKKVTSAYRQLGGLQNLDKVIDGLGGFDLKQLTGFLNQLPELFEGVEAVVEGVETSF